MRSIVSEINVVFQGDRTKKVGVVDSQYVVHKGIQTLGGSDHGATKVFSSSLYISFVNLYCVTAN